MDFKVGLTDEAIADLAAIVAFLAQRSPEAAFRIGSDLLTTAESLALFPHRGSPIKDRPGMRRILRWQWAIYYRVNASRRQIDVLRIRDCRRAPSDLRL